MQTLQSEVEEKRGEKSEEGEEEEETNDGAGSESEETPLAASPAQGMEPPRSLNRHYLADNGAIQGEEEERCPGPVGAGAGASFLSPGEPNLGCLVGGVWVQPRDGFGFGYPKSTNPIRIRPVYIRPKRFRIGFGFGLFGYLICPKLFGSDMDLG